MSLTPVLQHSSRSRRPTNQSSAALSYLVATISFFFHSLALSVCVLSYLIIALARLPVNSGKRCLADPLRLCNVMLFPWKTGKAIFMQITFTVIKVLNFSIVSLKSLLYMATNVYRSSPELGFYDSISRISLLVRSIYPLDGSGFNHGARNTRRRHS